MLSLSEISELPLRATVAFALRCAKRVEPILHLRPLVADAFSTGLEIGQVRLYGGTASRAAADAVASAAHAAISASDAAAVAHAAALAAHAAALAVGDDDLVNIPKIDFAKLAALNLGAAGEPGQPIRWNDPRLGPLWPHGEPTWYTEVVALCRELEEKIRCAPDPNAPPPPPFAEEQAEDRSWLAQLQTEGKLKKYRGKYVIAANKEILAAGRSLVKVHPKAEKLAEKKGIDVGRLVLHFVPGLE